MSTKSKAGGGQTAKTSTSVRPKQRTSKKSRAKAVRKRLDLACEHVSWASGIVTCCAYAAAAGLAPAPERDDLEHALKGAHALLEQAGGALLDVLDDELDEGGEL